MVRLINGLLNDELVIILVEVKIVRKVRREQIVHERNVSQVMREPLDSSHKIPGDLDSRTRSEVFAISRLIGARIQEHILFVSLNHMFEVFTEEQAMELLLVEGVHKTEELLNFLLFGDLDKAKFVEFLINCAHERGVDSEVTFYAVTEELDFINVYWVLQIDKKSTPLIPLATVSIVLFIISEYFIIMEWLSFNLEGFLIEGHSVSVNFTS